LNKKDVQIAPLCIFVDIFTLIDAFEILLQDVQRMETRLSASCELHITYKNPIKS
jgi:hypothetical protein